jgi:hypothetical protein
MTHAELERHVTWLIRRNRSVQAMRLWLTMHPSPAARPEDPFAALDELAVKRARKGAA